MGTSDQFQGMRSSMREAGHRLTSLVSTSVKYVCGSTPLSLQVSTSEAMHAQFCAPSSWPAKSAFLLDRLVGCVAVALHHAAIAIEQLERMNSAPAWRVSISDGGRIIP